MRIERIRPCDGVWAAFRRSGQVVAAPGLAKDCKWHFGTVCDVSRGLRLTPGGQQLPHVHAGAVYYRAAPDTASVGVVRVLKTRLTS